MLTVRSSLVLAALAISSPALADTSEQESVEIDMTPSTAAPAASNDVVFHRLIEFAPASARVYSADRELIARMAKTWLHGGQQATITVHGYSESLDLGLAMRRANNIKRYLIKAGVSPTRIAVVGHTLDKQGRRIDLAIAAK